MTNQLARNQTQTESDMTAIRATGPRDIRGIFGYFISKYPYCRVFKHSQNERFLEVKKKIEEKFRELVPVAYISFMNYTRLLKSGRGAVTGLAVGFHFWHTPFAKAPSLVVCWETNDPDLHDERVDKLLYALENYDFDYKDISDKSQALNQSVRDLVEILRYGYEDEDNYETEQQPN